MSHPQPAALSAAEEPQVWQPHAAEEFQQVDKVGKIAVGLLGASTVTHLLSTWSDWNTYGVVHTYLGGGPNVDDADLNRADAIAKITAYPNVLISVAAAVVFVIWLWRARVNSEVLCQADHRRSHGWVLASWFCPGPNLFYPKQIVDDVWLASDPATPVYADDLRRLRKPLLTKVWWCTWVGALAFDVVIRRLLMWMDATVGSLRGIALAGTASLILTVASAVAATFVIRKINSMQTSREWVPWWDQREPKLTAVPTYADDDTSEQMAISEPIAVAPTLRLERQPEPVMQLAGGGAEEAPPQWSPFAPVAESWQQQAPANPHYRPVESWGDDTGTLTSPVEEATPSYQPTAAGVESPSWASPAGQYSTTSNDDLLSAPLPSWQAETVAPPPLSLVDTSYASTSYEISEPSWSTSYSEPYSYETSASDYLPPSEPIAAPEPEPAPAPVARAGRRAARVAVDSPSTIGLGQDDDYLTPSKPLPTVPSYGPEPSYTPEPAYTPETSYTPEPAYTPETTYNAYEAPAASSSYESSSYSTDYTSYDYPAPAETTYTAPEPTYPAYDSYTPAAPVEPTYDGYSPSYDSYSQNSYGSTEYGTESYDSSYSPNYTPESYTAPDSTYTPEQPATEYQQQTPYSYEPAEPPAADDAENTAPRTVPRRRWV
ncbi:DUF4328 domain-containing protein [Kribbella qitaiheensis]|uniref:DUF4328 domain-containing protein n=1 Tax=Kribbella qitaiheensis TaxID=1544730 RepID=A0A7G6X0Y2_9ACTN|nr:DUF4328 domain-containing protein [Kribbella qitaiheensis]QNE19897.1 DUF4328 domain-containing protein [Kribbella qitaiheensis]